METTLVFLGWGCLALGVILAIPLLILGAKIGETVGNYIGEKLGTFFRSLGE